MKLKSSATVWSIDGAKVSMSNISITDVPWENFAPVICGKAKPKLSVELPSSKALTAVNCRGTTTGRFVQMTKESGSFELASVQILMEVPSGK